MKYSKIFEDSCENLNEMKNSNSFNPKDEKEIIQNMKLSMEDNKLADEPIDFKPYNKIPELNLYRLKKLKNFHKDEHCLFTGLKIIKDVKNKKLLLDEYRDFILKLYNEFDSSVRRRFVIFDKTNTLTRMDIEFLEKCQKTNKVKIFLC